VEVPNPKKGTKEKRKKKAKEERAFHSGKGKKNRRNKVPCKRLAERTGFYLLERRGKQS